MLKSVYPLDNNNNFDNRDHGTSVGGWSTTADADADDEDDLPHHVRQQVLAVVVVQGLSNRSLLDGGGREAG